LKVIFAFLITLFPFSAAVTQTIAFQYISFNCVVRWYESVPFAKTLFVPVGNSREIFDLLSANSFATTLNSRLGFKQFQTLSHI
jgi:hypothetical protein